MRRLQAFAPAALTVALMAVVGVMALGSASAIAAPAERFYPGASFDGSATPDGSFDAGNIVFNHATGNLLIVDQAHNSVVQVDPGGNPVDFPALGSPVLPLAGVGHLAIDNSGGATQGNFYLQSGNQLWGFKPDGGVLSGAYPLEGDPSGTPSAREICGVAVAPDGNVWALEATWFTRPESEYTPAGIPTGRSFDSLITTGCNGAFDGLGSFYRSSAKYAADNGFAYLGDTGGFISAQMAIDPLTSDVYSVREKGNGESAIDGLKYSDPLVFANSPFETIPLSSKSGGFAFDSSGVMFVAEGSMIQTFRREPPQPAVFTKPTVITAVYPRVLSLSGELASKSTVTAVRIEYGTDTSYGSAQPAAGIPVPFSFSPTPFTMPLIDLAPSTTYHLRVVVSNEAGMTYGPDMVVTTGPEESVDTCPNALARKQTGASRTPDCRAYELVSAADTGGYDVESSLIAGQTPFLGFPQAKDRVLYATHSGAVPGPWKATNKGPDPYLATRGENGWSTNYVGLPSDINPLSGGFSSVLGGADTSLSTFAFAGTGLCSPCFSTGLETGIPLRLPSGHLAQGMSGSLAGSVPASAKPEGKVAKHLSADGRHLIFASKYAFEPGANDNGSDLTVYDRNLATGTTQIASTTPAGATLTGAGIPELDVSSNGSRIVIGQKVVDDPAGNEYLRPYLHLGSSPNSVDLAPGTTSGVLYAGMTSDGSKLFFTTVDKLLGADTDESADLYVADVDASGNLSLSLITTPDSGACSPVANSKGTHWNSTGTAPNCDAVAIAGGGGVASQSGAIYFLSPEQLDGVKGTADQPNLYVAQPGQAPSFVATLSPDDALVTDSVGTAATRRTADFQATPSGGVIAFPSTASLTANGSGVAQVFRWEAASDRLDCVSCQPATTTDSALAANGASLSDDGRLFFTTPSALVLADTNKRLDVYEWTGEKAELITTGTATFDSALLSVSVDGTDAYFFTREALAPEEDNNGARVRIYDARVNGGFFKLPSPVACAASDECHGPGTVAPGAPDIRSSGRTTAGNVLVCAKNRVKKRGKCVKRQTHAKKKKAHAKKRAAKSSGKRGGRNA